MLSEKATIVVNHGYGEVTIVFTMHGFDTFFKLLTDRDRFDEFMGKTYGDKAPEFAYNITNNDYLFNYIEKCFTNPKSTSGYTHCYMHDKSGSVLYHWDGVYWNNNTATASYIQSCLRALNPNDYLQYINGDDEDFFEIHGQYRDNPFGVCIARKINYYDPNTNELLD